MTETHEATSRRRRRTPARGRAKGILAIAAGAALIVGGGYTYASWSTSTTLTDSAVQAGDLNLQLGTGSWTIDGVITDPTPITGSLENVRVVPGDVLTLTQPLTVTLVGTTIAADLSTSFDSAIPAELAPYVTVGFSATGFGAARAGNVYRITPAAGNAPIAGTATVTITFSGDTPDRVGVTQTINLDKVAFNLTQASS
ncbi:alternate-type signal peptide domain-containing protein [Microbacterium sp. SORGH_AS_0888]|uniref:alternate-type signal peptide domain-containing protein n=1 Tax=Microbacterium sp. SORGH_AS_0888 TaxID=3041791 RepID=UPI00277D3EF4|nr:alternate-type signal peptide domain-containing protein [Microbacterium sp. SORGH_AS_0888]MDQ1130098.1 alternate signal-mediated exported protein [Microbacterium sp. SORGH_AS_0888]